ncbi:M56 family metallopeptidase [Sphingomonas sp. HDW15A]|uniref:M56 family metallopeptidase n=1 Tax=Sphingomonas sp. HDW15A TaxID=2714942 RepID=UPI0014078306|nr:M56 family metallopeptidase [Sphingomonas sp. HDW15A]QIK96455.1 M56 family metallopeptidase [Sphingomonas sp. HDW15A]
MMGPLIAIALKSLIVAGGVLAILRLAQKRSAADRSLIAHLGLFAMLLLPFGSLLLPPLGVAGPQFLAGEPEFIAAPVKMAVPAATSTIALEAATLEPAAEPAASILSSANLPAVLYGLPALLLIGLTLVALVRLGILKSRANVLVEPEWVTALARAQHRMGFKHGTALLTSDELPSPISWGVVRPIILLNSEAAKAHNQAEAVIAHELAHVAHLDWAKLLLARVVIALFWFNPLVWLLAREAHQLREEAADDSVLSANIEDTDYAQLLVGVARHECRGLLIGAHGVAPAKNSLARRVRRVLDSALERAPGGWRWTSAAAFFAAGMAVPLAALTVVPGVQPVSASASLPAGASAKVPVPAMVGTDLAAAASSAAAQPAAEARLATAVDPREDVTVTADGRTMLVDKQGRAIVRGPQGTFIASPDGSAFAYVNGNAIATARAGAAVSVDGRRIDTAVARRAMGADAAYADAMRRAMPGVPISDEQLVKLKALGVTKDYVRALSGAGYRGLPLSTVVELRALQVMPGDIARAKKATGRLPTPQEMVKIKALGVSAQNLSGSADPDPDPDDGS